MANVGYDGLNEEESKIINDALGTPEANWANIASQIQDDLKQGRIGRFESSPLQEVAKLDRMIAQNIGPGAPDRSFPQFQIDGDGSISFTTSQHSHDTKVIGPGRK